MIEKSDTEKDLVLLAVAKEHHTFSSGRLTEHVYHARQSGATWAQIGAVLGITKQAAQQAYGRTRVSEREPLAGEQPLPGLDG